MRTAEFRYLIFSDVFRIAGRADVPTVIKSYIRHATYRYMFWLRLYRYVIENKLWFVRPIVSYMYGRMKYRLGISIPPGVSIGPGFYIGHFGGIVINKGVVIGKNCNISHGVTIGQRNRGEYKGCPAIGDNVYIGPGAVIVGAIRIGNNVAIGANAVVTKDLPDSAVAVGVPAKVISHAGSTGYINRIDYDKYFQ